MSTPTIDIEPLLPPIAPENPSGKNLFYELEYGELEEARRSDDDAPQGDVWQRKTKTADWEKVIKQGAAALTKKSKDLQIAAWMTEALGHRHGPGGLRDGFRLMHALQEAFWDSYYPQAEDGDLETRYRPFDFLNNEKLLPFLIRSIPLTEGFHDQCYSFRRYAESREVSNAGLRDASAMEALVAAGKITAQDFDDAVTQTSRDFYIGLADDLAEAIVAFKEFEDGTDARFGRDAPSLVNVRKALDEVRNLAESLLERKGGRPSQDEPEVEEPASDDWGASPEESAADSWSSESQTATKPKRTARPRGGGGPIADPEDARGRILDAAAFLRQNEPGHPAPFLVVRALRLADLYALGDPPDLSTLNCPPSDLRQALKRLSNEGDYTQLLEQAETAAGAAEARAWLDPHRYALEAMGTLSDADYTNAARAVRGMLRGVLADFADLPRAAMADDSPTANEATRAWIDSEIAPGARHEAAGLAYSYEPPAAAYAPGEPSGTEAEPDAFELAREEVRSGQVAEGLNRIRREMARATNGRERFLRKLQLAELCLMAGNSRVALPLLDDLARQIDAYKLEDWEDESLCARVWGALYRCLRGAAGAESNGIAERLQDVYRRLCRLDIGQAMSLGEGPG